MAIAGFAGVSMFNVVLCNAGTQSYKQTHDPAGNRTGTGLGSDTTSSTGIGSGVGTGTGMGSTGLGGGIATTGTASKLSDLAATLKHVDNLQGS